MPNPVDGQFVKWAIGGACFVHTRTGKDVKLACSALREMETTTPSRYAAP
jgi:hypothetical protein